MLYFALVLLLFVTYVATEVSHKIQERDLEDKRFPRIHKDSLYSITIDVLKDLGDTRKEQKVGEVRKLEGKTSKARRLWWKLLDFPEDAHYFLKDLIFRGKHGFHRSDAWNLNTAIAEFAVPRLKYWIAHGTFGYPQEFSDKYGESAAEEWDTTLKKILWSLEQVIEDDGHEYYATGTIDFNWVKLESGYYEMTPGENHTYEIDKEKLKEYNNRVQEGLDLFGKYFRNLWD